MTGAPCRESPCRSDSDSNFNFGSNFNSGSGCNPPNTLPASSMWTPCRPSSSNLACSQAARVPSAKGGAGMPTHSVCQRMICCSCRWSQPSAAWTCRREAICPMCATAEGELRADVDMGDVQA